MGVNFFRGLWVPNALRARRGRELQGKDRVTLQAPHPMYTRAGRGSRDQWRFKWHLRGRESPGFWAL